MESEEKESLVQKIFLRLKTDSAFRAALKRADNPATEYKSWEYLADFGVNLENKNERLLYTTIFAAIAKSGRESDGNLEFGKALCAAYDWDKESAPARSKLRRVIACGDLAELCAVLRSILQFISSKNVSICYQKLLDDLRFFGSGEKAKSKWAAQFYNSDDNDGEEK